MTRNLKQINKQRGFIGSIITIIIGLSLIGYVFDWNIIDFIKSPAFQNVWNYIERFFSILWKDYISKPAMFVWNEFFVDIVWKWTLVVIDYLKGWIDSKS